MINLTNHSCSHCQHLNRYARTQHGNTTEYIRSLQKQIAHDVEIRDYKNISYLNRKLEEAFHRLSVIERGYSFSSDYLDQNRRTTRGKRMG